jgi:hypothetical protein
MLVFNNREKRFLHNKEHCTLQGLPDTDLDEDALLGVPDTNLDWDTVQSALDTELDEITKQFYPDIMRVLCRVCRKLSWIRILCSVLRIITFMRLLG